MKILPVLVYTEYDQALLKQIYDQQKIRKKSNIGNKFVREMPSKLYVLNSKYYPVEFRMEPGSEGELFVTRQHFQTKDDWHNNKDIKYVPGFCIVDLFQGESDKDFEIKYKPNRTGKYETLTFLESQDQRICKPIGLPTCRIFFELPFISVKFDPKKEQYNIEYESELDTAVLGYINTGFTEIACFKKDSIKPDLKCYLKVLPSSMTEATYAKMVNDILMVHRVLLESLKGKQSLSLNKSWHNSLLDIENKLESLETVFHQIEKKYYTRLTMVKTIVNKQNLKKFNDKLLIQYIAQPFKPNYKADKLFEDNNIYEHRILLWALHGLMRFIDNTTKTIDNVHLFEKKKKNFIKSQLFNLYNLNDIDDMLVFIQALSTITKKESKEIIFDKLIQCKEIDIPKNSGVSEIVKDEIVFLSFHVYDSISSIGGYPEYCCSRGFKGTTFCIRYLCDHETAGKVSEFYLEFMSNDIQKQELLYQEFSKIKVRETEYSECDIKGITLSLSGTYRVSNTEKVSSYQFFHIDEIIVNGELKHEAAYSDAKNHLRQVYCANEKSVCESEILLKWKDIDELEYLGKELNEERKRFDKVNDNEIQAYEVNKEKIEGKINKLKKCTFLRRLTEHGNETWNLTQKFINDQNYRRAYSILHRLNERYHYADVNNQYSVIHKKANDLYEYWILIKILEVLILKQKWEMREIVLGSNEKGKRDIVRHIKYQGESLGKGISDIISKILSEKISENTTKNILEATSFVLFHEVGKDEKAKLTLSYNKDIVFPNGLTVDSRYYKNYYLTPDYLFVIEFKDNNGGLVRKRFCLDAKYRNYVDQKRQWASDINDVCIERYLIRLGKCLEQIKQTSDDSGEVVDNYVSAFIIHSDEKKYPYWGGTLRNSVDIEKLGLEYPEHKFGSFPFVPNVFTNDDKFSDFERNLLTFFTMVFEYHCELYDVCWECGNTEIKSEKKPGGSIHYTCDNCNRFWVKYHCQGLHHPLIKHRYNYHHEYIPHTHFLVMCPKCGDKLQKD